MTTTTTLSTRARSWRGAGTDPLTMAWCGLMAVGMTGLSALDGTPGWCVARAALIIAIAVAVALLSRHESHWRATSWALAASGTLAAAAGGTIAVASLGSSVASVEEASGLTALLGGTGALMTGASRLVRAAHRWRRLLAIPVVAAVAYVIVLPVTIAVLATNVPRPRLDAETPADRGLDFVDATVRTSDGVDLSGWYVPSANGAAVVLLHGASSTRSNVLDQAVVLARHGYGVLLVDARGHGRSGGRAMELGWYGERDVAAAVDYLCARHDVEPNRIGAVGMSMGGEEAIGAMGADPRIAAVVAEGATNRVFSDTSWLPDEYGVRGRLQRIPDWITYHLADLLTSASPPRSLRDSVRVAAPRPVLLVIAGTRPDEQHAADSMLAASPTNVELWTVPGAGHTGGLQTAPAAWESRVVGFLDRNLGR